MMKGYICTLGFDEKFIFRFMVRHKIDEDDVFILIVSKDYTENEKALNAYKNVEVFVSTILPRQRFHTFTIDIYDNPIIEIRKLAKKIYEVLKGSEEIYVGLSGGMRIIILETLFSFLLLPSILSRKIIIEVDYETLTGRAEIPLAVFTIGKNERIIKILHEIKSLQKITVKDLAEKTGLSIATISRELSTIRQLKLINEENRLTKLGEKYLALYS